jgi:hypothetical protein
MITSPRRAEPFPTWKMVEDDATALSLIVADLTPDKTEVDGFNNTCKESTPAFREAKFEFNVNLEEAIES